MIYNPVICFLNRKYVGSIFESVSSKGFFNSFQKTYFLQLSPYYKSAYMWILGTVPIEKINRRLEAAKDMQAHI